MEVVCEQFEAMHAPTAQEMKALVNLSRLRSQWYAQQNYSNYEQRC